MEKEQEKKQRDGDDIHDGIAAARDEELSAASVESDSPGLQQPAEQPHA